MGLPIEVSAHSFTLYANLSSLPLQNHDQAVRMRLVAMFQRGTPGDHAVASPPPSRVWRSEPGHDWSCWKQGTMHTELKCCKSRQLPA